MMPAKSLLEAFNSGVYVETIADQSVQFKALTLHDIGELHSALKTDMLDTLRKNQTYVGRDPIKAKVVSEILLTHITDEETVAFCDSIRWATWVVQRSLQNAGQVLDAATIQPFQRAEITAIILALSGLIKMDPIRLEEAAADEEKELGDEQSLGENGTASSETPSPSPSPQPNGQT